MSEIFISYRHGDVDAWAAKLLNDTLQDDDAGFDVFLDTRRQRNDFGDDFVDRIDSALSDCRVVFAIIGPAWVAGMSRFNDPKDRVRYELRAALGRTGVRVVPLFVNLEAYPDLSTLPADLRSLERKTGTKLEIAKWDTEAGTLIESLRHEWLTVAAHQPQAAAVTVPRCLPYLCNRTEQEDAVNDHYGTAAAAPVAFVAHGYREEAHLEFLERVTSEGGLLEDVLGARDGGLTVKVLEANQDKLSAGRYADVLRSAMKVAVLGRRTATDDELMAWLTGNPKPLVAVLHLTWANYQAFGPGVLDGLIDAWRTLLPSAETARARLAAAALLWISLTYDDPTTAIAQDKTVILPKLRPIEEDDILRWVGRDDVRRYLADKRDRLLQLAQDQNLWIQPRRLPMRRFAEGALTILAAR